MDEIRTGGGASVGEGVDTGGGEFSGRDHKVGRDEIGRDQINQIVNLHLRDRLPEGPEGDQIVAEVASEIWKTIAALNQLIGKLEYSSQVQAKATEKLSETVDAQNKVITLNAEQAERNHQASMTAYQTLAKELPRLRRIELALRGTMIKMPEDVEEDGHPLPVKVTPPNKWQPYLTPAILTLILLTLIFLYGSGGR